MKPLKTSILRNTFTKYFCSIRIFVKISADFFLYSLIVWRLSCVEQIIAQIKLSKFVYHLYFHIFEGTAKKSIAWIIRKPFTNHIKTSDDAKWHSDKVISEVLLVYVKSSSEHRKEKLPENCQRTSQSLLSYVILYL